VVLTVVEVGAELAGAVSGIAEHFGAGGFLGDQAGGGLGVTDVAGGEITRGDETAVGFHRDVSFEPVAIVVGRWECQELCVTGVN
jgi:hypothetical protein